MISTAAKLKERVKELTCLYEVTSILVNSDYNHIEHSLEAIALCLKRAWQFAADTEVQIAVANYHIQTKKYKGDAVSLNAAVKVFNKTEGKIIVSYPADRYAQTDFLDEEQVLLNNVSLSIGGLLERKRIKEREAATRRQIERADRLHILGEITAGIAHELNTPLTNILGFSELLKDKMQGEEDRRDLQRIMDNAIFSREIVKKLLFFACAMPQQMEQIDLLAVIDNVVKLLKPQLADKRIVLKTDYGPGTVALKADTVQMTQVFFNLIMNAIYHSPAGGTLQIVVAQGPHTIDIAISDEGPGIAQGLVDKIFEPFFTTKPIGAGSGLGLSVVHGIIESHKGRIAYRDNMPKGAIFDISLPKMR